ncbi:Lsr2 family DNA-binding protein [Cellulomonas persica]
MTATRTRSASGPRSRGSKVSERGRISAEVREAYDKAH